MQSPAAYVPPVLWRRWKLIAATLLACMLLFWIGGPPSMLVHLPTSAPRAFVDTDIVQLVDTIPGAKPGVAPAGTQAHATQLAHVLRNGTEYPSREELKVLLLEHLRIDDLSLDKSVWPAWLPWLEGHAPRPRYMHYDYLTELRRLPGGSIDDVRQFLEAPLVWRIRHNSKLGVSVVSKTYCPYSRGAKALLRDKGAKIRVHEADLRGASLLTDDYDTMHRVIRALYAHRTFPAVIVGTSLVGGYDDTLKIDRDGYLDSILRGIGAL